MIKREMRIVYEFPSAKGNPVRHAVKASSVIPLKVLADKIKEVGYKLIEVQERFYDDKDPYWKEEEWRKVEPRK